MTRALAVIEDPGAANGMVGLADALAARGIDLTLYAGGAARDYAAAIGLKAEPLPDPAETILTPAPAALLVGTSEDPDALSFALTHGAHGQGIPTIGFVDGPANADLRFRGRDGDALAHRPDHLAVPETLTANAFRALGVSATDITVVGHPHVDRVRAARTRLDAEGRPAVRQRLFPDLPAERKLILFAAEISDGLDPAAFHRSPDYTLHGRGDTDGRTEICLEEIIDALAALKADAALAVRLHPKNDPALVTPYLAEINAVSRGGDPLEACYAADLVLGMTSILLFEAAVLGRPTLSLTPRKAEAEWLIATSLGLTPNISNRPGLLDALARALSPRGLGTPGNIDALAPAGAADNLAALIERLVKKGT